ncbi:MAG: tol-pal system YbgF family protein, partial [Planctomycetota bacterium]
EGRFEQAAQLAAEFLKKCPQSGYHARVLLTLGEGRLALKEYDAAEKTFSFVAGDEKEKPELRVRAVSRIGWCRFLKGDAGGAAQVFQDLAANQADSEEVEEAGYMAGRAWVKAGQPDAAKAAWSAYLEAHPQGQHGDAVLLGLAGLLEGDARTGRLKELLAKFPQSKLVVQALFDLGEQLSAENQPEEAALQYQQVIQRAPKSELALRAHYSLAWILYQKEQFDPAVAHLAMVANHPKTPPDLRMATWELLVWTERKRGNPDGAVEAYRNYAQGEAGPDQKVETAKIAAAALKDAGKIDEADALLEEAAAGTGGGALAAGLQVERVYLALDRDQVDQAEELARKALQIAPANPAAAEALFFVGEALFDLGENDRAAEVYKLAAGVPESPVADRSWYKQGFALLRAGKPVEAAGAFGQVVERFPKSELYGECLFLRGEAWFQAGRLEEAVVDLARLRTELPKHEVIPKDLFRLGIALCRLERWEEADAALSELSRNFPDFENGVEGELWRGRALAALGRPRGALQAFDAVLAKDNGVLAARAHLEVGKLDFDAGSLDEALSEFLKVAVLYSNEAEVSEALYRAGGCLEKMGDSDRAVAQYREVLQKYPKTEYAAPSRERLKQLGAL